MPESLSGSVSSTLTAVEQTIEQDLPLLPVKLQILFERDDDLLPECLTEDFMQHCCHAAFEGQDLLLMDDIGTLELSVQLLDAQAMQALNKQYRQKDKATNVLSFASGLPLMVNDGVADADASLLVLGDVVLCPEVVAREADEQGKLLLHHWAHMLIHGCLHLCGYDHEIEQEAQLMEAAEVRILSGLGMPDPYAVDNKVNG